MITRREFDAAIYALRVSRKNEPEALKYVEYCHFAYEGVDNKDDYSKILTFLVDILADLDAQKA
jgi:hypothetical protein